MDNREEVKKILEQPVSLTTGESRYITEDHQRYLASIICDLFPKPDEDRLDYYRAGIEPIEPDEDRLDYYRAGIEPIEPDEGRLQVRDILEKFIGTMWVHCVEADNIDYMELGVEYATTELDKTASILEAQIRAETLREAGGWLHKNLYGNGVFIPIGQVIEILKKGELGVSNV